MRHPRGDRNRISTITLSWHCPSPRLNDFALAAIAKAATPGPYLVGEQFTAADVVIGSGLAWAMMIKAIPERPEILAYTSRLQARPALQRVFAKDADLAAAQAS